jgi:hypothetical protein
MKEVSLKNGFKSMLLTILKIEKKEVDPLRFNQKHYRPIKFKFTQQLGFYQIFR